MTAHATHRPALTADVRFAVDRVGDVLARYGLVVVIGWIGALKFTSFEAQGIQPLVAHSPVMSWVYAIVSVTTFSTLLGVVEIAAALLLAIKPVSPKLSLMGSAIAAALFLATISFLLTTPGSERPLPEAFPCSR